MNNTESSRSNKIKTPSLGNHTYFFNEKNTKFVFIVITKQTPIISLPTNHSNENEIIPISKTFIPKKRSSILVGFH
jgi:hypothetical protein